MWTLEKFIEAGLLKKKDDPTMNGIDYFYHVWVPNGCTLNVCQDGYHDFIHYVYELFDGELRFATGRSINCKHTSHTAYRPVMADKSIDVIELHNSLAKPEQHWLSRLLRWIVRW